MAKVQYVAKVKGGVVEHVSMPKGACAATLYRFGRAVVTFYPSKVQRRRIRAKRGTVRITSKQIAQARTRCRR